LAISPYRILASAFPGQHERRLHVEKVEGFGSNSFTENHATSFGLLVYVSCGIKRRYPDAMLAGLLDSQPVGVYATAQLIRDAMCSR